MTWLAPRHACVWAVLALTGLHACSADRPEAAGDSLGDPERGLELIALWGCGSCHTVPKVALARGNVGPPLARMGSRGDIAGVLPNTPENLVRWIQSPQHIDARTAMPAPGVPEAAARDMAAYLYSLR